MCISDGGSDVCSSDLGAWRRHATSRVPPADQPRDGAVFLRLGVYSRDPGSAGRAAGSGGGTMGHDGRRGRRGFVGLETRSEEHTSELQSLMRISYAVFCLKTKTKKTRHRQ